MPVYRIVGCVTRTMNFTVDIEADDEDIAVEIAEGDAWEHCIPSEYDTLDVEIYEADEVTRVNLEDVDLQPGKSAHN